MSSKLLSVDQALQNAALHIKKGELDNARQLCRYVLVEDPTNEMAMQELKAMAAPVTPPQDTELKQQQLDNIAGLYTQGRPDDALTQGLVLAQQYPDTPLIINLLGNIYAELGQKEEAIASYYKALELKPDYIDAYNNLGATLIKTGKYAEAIAVCNRAVDLDPNYVAAYVNLGKAYTRLGEYKKSIDSYRSALKLNANDADVYYNMGNVLARVGMYEIAISSCSRAVELDNNHLLSRGTLLLLFRYICDWNKISDTLESDLKSLEFGDKPKEVMPPFGLLSLIDDARFHRKVSEAYLLANYKPSSILGPISNRKNPGKIRIGYFSADFYNHATMYLMAELFEQHDRSKFEIHVFSFGPDRQDEMRSRLINSVDGFHDVRLKGDAEIASLSRSLGIVIAVDLKGYSTHARTGIFSYGAASVQVNYLGYPGTMGAPYIDYIIADPTIIPLEHQDCYSEKIVYLPNSYQINDSTREISDKALSRSDCGLPEKSFVFCCFNNNYKISPDNFDIWMRLLNKVEGSVLWLLKANKLSEQNLRKEAAKRGINPDRLIFADRMLLPEHLARHRLADLFLDTFNYNAHTTASDALWAGLPVLTKIGEEFSSRVAGSLLNAIGVPELITTTIQEYEDTALMFATQPHELQTLKEKLSRNLKTTPLFDATLFTRHIEKAYMEMIKRQNEGLEPDHIYVEN